MSAAQLRRALSVFPKLKVANFALLLSVRRTENRINLSKKKKIFQQAKINVGCAVGL